MLTSTDPLSASEASELGLADKLAPRAELENECREAVRRLAQLPVPVVSATRELVFSQRDQFEQHVDRSLLMAVKILQSHYR